MGNNKKPKLSRLEKKIKITELMATYKLKEDEVVEKLNKIIKEELELSPNLDDDLLYDLVMRSFKLEMRGHSISSAVPVRICQIAKKEAFDFAIKRRKMLQDLFKIDKSKAMNDGIGDAICDENGNIHFKPNGFNSGEYPEHRYNYPLILLAKIEKETKIITTMMFEDNELEVYEILKPLEWFDTKMSINDDKSSHATIGKFSSLSEFKKVKNTELDFIDLKKKTGLIYEEPLSYHHLNLADAKEYFEKYQEKGYIPIDRFIVVVGDIVSMTDDGKIFNIIDDSLDTETPPITVYDNRAERDIDFGNRSRILIFGELRYDKTRDSISIQCMGAYRIPREKGGFFYPPKIKAVKSILTEKTTEKKSIKTKAKDEEKNETSDKKKSKTTTKKTKTTKKDEEIPEIEFDEEKVNPDTQNEIVSAIYALEKISTYEEINEKSGLADDEEYKASFLDLLRKGVFKQVKGGYEI